MAYSSLANQAFHLFHFGLSFVLVFVLMPRWLFRAAPGSGLDDAISRYIRMVCFVILWGYVLLILKLYEALGFLGVVLLVALFRRSRSGPTRHTVRATAMALFYDTIESRYLLTRAWRRARLSVREWGGRFRARRKGWRPVDVAFVCLVLAVLGMVVYVRSADALTNPAPAMSDGYVTLAWMKYVDERILFHDGIYPQGMYFYMSILGKFAFIDALYILKYVGPLNAVFITLGIFYTLQRWTGRRDAPLVGMLLYGLFGYLLLGGDWVRQAATNSQEFGFVFVLPSLVFLDRFLEFGHPVDLETAAAGVYVTGLTHPLAYILALIGCGSVLVAHWCLPGPFIRRRTWQVVMRGVASAGVTVAPVVVGYALGRRFNSSGTSFAGATATTAVTTPALNATDWLGVAAIAVLLAASAREVLRRGPHRVWVAGGIFGLAMFLVYFAGGPVTHSVVLIARALDMWAIVQPLVVGLAVHVLMTYARVLGRLPWLRLGVASGLFAVSLAGPGRQPIVPYKLQFADDVSVYLRINEAFRYRGYMLVANNEEYALVLGNGYRMDIGQFVKTYDPAKPPLTKVGQSQRDPQLAPYVFIYYPKRIFEVSPTNSIYPIEAPLYAQRYKDQRALRTWLTTYARYHPLHVYYEDQNLIVYEIAIPQTK
ncbi:MAG: hypothetical protein K6T78_02210 [Alicyclobacillus sp.]|nr:hypothetical protein [Alicyclobacillus sp.]